MARSKLERFRDAHFPGESDHMAAPGDGSDPRSAHAVPARSPAPARNGRGSRRSGRGVGGIYRVVKLVLLLAPLAFLLLTTFVECGPRPSSMVPDFVRTTACARRDLSRHALSIEGTLKTVSDRLR